MHIITAKIKVFQKPQAFLTIIMINEAIKKQTEDNYYICNKMYLYYISLCLYSHFFGISRNKIGNIFHFKK